MRLSSSVLSAAALAFGLSLTGCTPAQQICTSEQKCGTLPTGESESQCETNSNNCINDLNKGGSSCQKLASDLNTLATCVAALSCSDQKAANNNNKCESQEADVVADSLLATGCDSSACTSSSSP